MKTLSGISLVLALVILSACAQKSEKEEFSSINLISIHDISIKPGVDEKEFETFVMSEIAPLYRKLKGQDLFLTKGYVGRRAGQYAIFITFPTVEDRNKVYPLSGGYSEEFDKVMEEADASIFAKFDSMAYDFDGAHCTDYVRVGQ